MTTKEYLGQVKKWDKIIEDRLSYLNNLRMRIDHVSSPPYDKDRIMASSSASKMEDNVVKVIDLERQVNIYIDMRQKIVRQIEQLAADEYNVIYMKFVNCLSFPDILERLNYRDIWSESKMYRAYKSGLEDFEMKFGESYL
jgi:hypothetical protein